MFIQVVTILLPIFAIMGLGYISGRLGILGDNSAPVLNRFVTHFSLPLLLFGALASSPLDKTFNLAFVVSLATAAVVCFVLPILLSRQNLNFQQRTMHGLGASFSNASFVGIPLLTPIVGTLALPAVGVANIILLTILAITVLVLELARSGNGHLLAAFQTALVHTFKNPIIFAMICGVAYSLSGLPLPGWLHRTTHIVGVATPAVALFAMGEALVKSRLAGLGKVGFLALIKLVAMPLITMGILLLFPDVEPEWAVSAVLTAALSTAILDYIVATEYRENAREASDLVLLTTLLSAVTLPVFIILSLRIWPVA
ncbi:AEC family transporter [Hoeflea poritis]|uniref:AEC family transporter n=1 Tax=Hoeflea poritis TaxID=2993659 RepID=A0ABT4VI52_9HYPH|nr:AEC family transporter [Hoeflea poritis]MDA4844368.1 AEC family transporter [Hoeflea poritis]